MLVKGRLQDIYILSFLVDLRFKISDFYSSFFPGGR